MNTKWLWLLPAIFVLQAAVQAQPPRPLPAQDSPLRQTAAQYHFSMNMLLFPDYFMTDDQFDALAKNQFQDNNLPAIVRGLKAYGYKVEMPQSARDYRDKVYPQMLKLLKDAGYTAVEIPVNGAVLELCPALKEEIAKQGLAVTAVGMAGEDLVASLKPRIDCTHALGAKVLAGPVVLPFKQYPDKAIGDARVAWVKMRLQSLVQPMREVAEYAKNKDVVLAVEPLNRFELPGLNRLQEAIDFVKMVDHPHFGVMIDTCHEMSDGEGPEVFAEQVKTLMKMGRLFHCHISAVHRGRVDKGWFDWQGFFGPMLANGYQGNMSMEIFDATLPFSEVVHINRPTFENPMEVTVSALIHAAQKLQTVKK
jgi:sugar phosphate isomerase/epimerase